MGVVLVVVDHFVCTLGVSLFIGVVVYVHWEVVVSVGFGAVSLCGRVAWLNVTCLFSCGVLSSGVENILGEFFKM